MCGFDGEELWRWEKVFNFWNWTISHSFSEIARRREDWNEKKIWNASGCRKKSYAFKFSQLAFPVVKKENKIATLHLSRPRMCNQAFYALKTFSRRRKILSPEILFLLRQMSRMVFRNCSSSIQSMMTTKRGRKGTLHKSYKHCRYDLINISQCHTM